MQKKSLVVLTAVAFVALVAFAQDIKTAISKTSGLQRSEYIETDKGKIEGNTVGYVCPGATECQNVGCHHRDLCEKCPYDSVCVRNGVGGQCRYCVNAPCVSGGTDDDVCQPERRHHRSRGCHGHHISRGFCYR